jgi:hypothetical protein
VIFVILCEASAGKNPLTDAIALKPTYKVTGEAGSVYNQLESRVTAQ